MRIRRPKSITVRQLMVITVIGVLGGVYIWKPLILRYRREDSDSSVKSDTIKIIDNLKAATAK